MKAGRTVMVEMADGSAGPVPVEHVEEFIKQNTDKGARIQRRPTTAMGRSMGADQIKSALLGSMPGAGAIGGSVAGGSAGVPIGAAIGGAVGGPPGALVGAALGGPVGRIIGGIAGGTLGQAAREGASRAMGQGDAPGTVAGEAVNQAGWGTVVEGAGGLGGRLLVRSGLGAKVADAGKAVEEMVAKRIPIGGFGRGGRKATKNWERATSARNNAVGTATLQGQTIPRAEVEKVIGGLIKEARSEMADDAEVRYLRKRLESWRMRKPVDINLSDVQSIITRFNARSRPVIEATKKRGHALPSQAQQAKATYQMEVANRLTELMEQALPGYKELNANVSRSIAAKNAVLGAERQSLAGRLAAGASLGSGLDYLHGDRDPRSIAGHGAAGAALLGSPALLSRGGLALTDPRLLALLQGGIPYLQPGQARE